MSEQDSADFHAIVPREQAGNAIGDALRLYVGRGRRYSVKQLSNATGVKDRMIECAMTRGYDHRPLPDWALLSVSKFLGADFVNEWLGLADLVAAEPVAHDHDALCEAAEEYVRAKTRAHREDSPLGRDLCPTEELPELDAQAVRLKVAR